MVVRGDFDRSWSLVVARGRLCSLVVARGHSWSLVAARSRLWSLEVACGRVWSLVVFIKVDDRCPFTLLVASEVNYCL